MTAAHAFEYLWRLQLIDPVAPFLPANVARWNAHYPCSVTKARAHLGYAPRFGLVEGVRRTVQWYRQNGYLCHSLPWMEGVLDLEGLPEPSNRWHDRALRAGGRVVQLAWNIAALTWRLPPKVMRRVGRRMKRSGA